MEIEWSLSEFSISANIYPTNNNWYSVWLYIPIDLYGKISNPKISWSSLGGVDRDIARMYARAILKATDILDTLNTTGIGKYEVYGMGTSVIKYSSPTKKILTDYLKSRMTEREYQNLVIKML